MTRLSSNLRRFLRPAVRRRARSFSDPVAAVESLEDRVLLSNVTLNNFNLVVSGSEGADAIIIDRAPNAQTVRVRVFEGNQRTILETFDRNKVYAIYVHGKGGADLLFNKTEFLDVLNGGAGDDIIIGGNNGFYNGLFEFVDSALIGGAGNDFINGRGGADLIVGQAGDDLLTGESGFDQLLGGLGDDRLYGKTEDDRIFGQAGNDRILGGAGDDRLLGGDGYDLVYGEFGNDSLAGGAKNDRVWGGFGCDFIDGGLNNDILRGEGDSDTLVGKGGVDIMLGGTGNDAVYGGASIDLMAGGSGNDFVSGGDGNDQLDGGIGNDVLSGELGDDWINGGAGVDRLTETGNVSYALSDTKLETYDSFAFVGTNVTFVNLIDSDMLAGIEVASLIGGAGNNGISALDPTLGGYAFTGQVAFHGMAGDDALAGAAQNDFLSGGTGNDILLGYDGKDDIEGGAGSDRINTLSSYVIGGAGDDNLDGGLFATDQTLGDGVDTIYGGLGDDRIDGDTGGDTMYGDFIMGNSPGTNDIARSPSGDGVADPGITNPGDNGFEILQGQNNPFTTGPWA